MKMIILNKAYIPIDKVEVTLSYKNEGVMGCLIIQYGTHEKVLYEWSNEREKAIGLKLGDYCDEKIRAFLESDLPVLKMWVAIDDFLAKEGK